MTHNWEDSRGECELYGGWLVQINDLKEYNCLLRFGVKEGMSAWFWTDGNDLENTWVWTHAYDNSDVIFFPPKISCGCYGESSLYCSAKGDAFEFYISDTDKQARGVYCDAPSSLLKILYVKEQYRF